jgi:hypothetical protein
MSPIGLGNRRLFEMRRARMDAIVDEIHREQKALFKTKGREYTIGSDDALANFKAAAAACGTTPALVCQVFLQKHLDAIRYGMENPLLSEPMGSRIVDACNYLLLLYALWWEAQEEAGEG